MTNSARNQYPDYAAMAARLRAAAEQIERMQQEHGPPHLRA
jgi:outer membrane protein TolC